MRYFALATDYDGTLATQGRVEEGVLETLAQLKASGRRLVMVTGRELDDLQRTFSHLEMFERIVAENGAVIYNPATREEKVLCGKPPDEFIELLRRKGVDRVSVGRVIVATWEPYEKNVLEAIRQLGLELQVIFNKGAVMVLPSGVNKATGLKVALEEIGISPHNVVGVGDAENDHAFLQLCECSIAVANALPMIKKHADYVTREDRGAGVAELAGMIMATDLKELEPQLKRHEIPLGTTSSREEVSISPYGASILLAGTSGGGKSTFATGLLERLREGGYQFCILDPEGDYQNFEEAVVLGDTKSPPSVDGVVRLIEKPEENAVVNLLGISLEHRPAFFDQLFPALLEMRARTGRPHWIVIDETHHLLPSTWDPATVAIPERLHSLLMITVHPDHVSRAILSTVDLIIAIGADPGQTIRAFSETLGEKAPSVPEIELEQGEMIAWWRRRNSPPFWFRSIPPKTERRRHRRKYAGGELPPERSFFFRGPDGRLNLRAQNLQMFLQIAEGVDDDTWMFHLRKEDYSEWFKRRIKDPDLAAAVKEIENDDGISPGESRKRIREKIEERYTGEE
jgi:HAD superfamily hydrolase (TIGR01484 family)